MQISIYGRTDKRACIYTLMKVLQAMGDVALVSSDRHFTRLSEEGTLFGYYQNISVFVTDATADEMWNTIEHKPKDFDHIILDNRYNEETDLIVYVQGAGVEALDEALFETFDDIVVIRMGRGKNAVPYSKALMQNLEEIEYYRKLVPPSPAMTSILAKVLSKHLNLPEKDIVKVVNKK